MAVKSMMVRPYVLSASCALSRALPSLFSQPRKTQLVLLHHRAISNENRRNMRLEYSGVRRFSPRSSSVGNAGSIDSPLIESMKKKIKEELNAESVSVEDLSGDGRHVVIDVVSSSFEGQSAVNRQRMVYKAIWEELQNTVHAVDQMTTKTPDEVSGKK
ncbi:LOW QUALITY PROTEIN: protein BOLA4, chloroplastic/mitochondrial [Pyrus x bretschneideri]|uniref:LOW QUALITY PROTEIN: protein BOLA4, chloroplastic/mitochondrial n=1 Tax=Pyrus x bretschneideri TaxID=225117 RepID=UPI00202EEBAC|nr:LOW QUALITY PROTEIN: protein BOLA4, chloroplastic/mitochondrial [Pyrus x bretschneideri]